MKHYPQQWPLLVILAVVGKPIFVAEAALAQSADAEAASPVQAVPLETGPVEAIPSNKTESAATTVDEWLRQIAQTEIVEITNVQLEEIATGLTLQLETNGELATPETSITGNAIIADIPNAVLRLPEGDDFSASDPAAGIALINITNLPDNQVRLAITGTDAPPALDLSIGATGLTANVTLGDPTAQSPDDDSIQIVVTGEEGSRYVGPNATTGTRTDTPLRDIPQSIQVIPQEVLEDQQATDLDGALRNISGVTLSRSNDPTGQRFILRGFENPSVLRDGFRLSFGATGATGFQELSNVEQIEVLKGPAAILFGVVEPGGVINLVSEQPTSEPFYEFEFRVVNREVIEPRVDISGPLTEDARVSYRLNASSNLYLFRGVPQETFDLQTNLVAEFNTGDIEHTVLAGVDLFRRNGGTFVQGDAFSPIFINVFDPVYGTVPDQDPETLPILFSNETQTDALGVYLQDQVTLADNLKLLLGVRYDTVEQETINNPSFFSPTGSESTQTDDAFSPRFGVVYQPIEEVALFTSYSRSFSPNSGTTVAGDILEPEEGEQFEIGAKAELLGGRFSASLAYFNITLQNVATPDPDFPNFSVATGQQRSQGVELDLAGEILPGWNLIANYAYIDASITDDNSGLEGNRLFNVPEHNFNLWTTYDIQNGPLTGLGFGIGFNYVSDRFGDNANSFELDSYFLTNAAISYRRDNWQAGLNFRNLFDIDYIQSAGNSRTIRIDPGKGLTVIGSVSVEF
ncbi:TonB-dependent siderophore receptor [Halomicronema hongdechloris C2206]|uniref:TonB-dependent siderophore receptor n=1 Tax=Halomicronema hongdechloris C2206 TaxID=1641165 RepID=A0A1Z3HR82_9CYAN|nr:TonB-dependent siderophore receptor [Halomicronema hongdechloris]ASC72647.1 TonB-dependent siderophore receptor [Halomicronema hongdechloris C2206]